MNDVTCIVCNYPKHYRHFPLQDFDQMIIPICSRCLALAEPNLGWGENIEETIAMCRKIVLQAPSRYDFSKR